MDLYQTQTMDDRTPGHGAHAAGDGIAPGSAYSGFMQTDGRVVIPTLDPLTAWTVHIPSNLRYGGGEQVLVIFDDGKIPWVVQMIPAAYYVDSIGGVEVT